MAWRKVGLVGLVLLTLLAYSGGFLHHAQAAQAPLRASHNAQSSRPHIGYGIHVAPHTGADLGWVNRLGMDWVKVYTDEHAARFRDLNVLYRMDLAWPNGDWGGLRNNARQRAIRLTELGVEAVEVHNEPNLQVEWPRGPDAAEYTQVLRAAYEEIKAVNPNMIVVSAGLASTLTNADRSAITDVDFAREMLDNGAGNYFDVFAYHNYGYDAPPEQAPAANKLNFRRAELIRQVLVQYGLSEKPIWLTEFGWLRDPGEDGVLCSDIHEGFYGFSWQRVDGRTQADYIVRAFQYADENWPWAGPMFLWNLNWSMLPDAALPQCSHMRWFSILRKDGSPTLAVQSVAAMPRNIVTVQAEMTLVALDDMTVEVGVGCLGIVEVGRFLLQNTGTPGTTFDANIIPARSVSGPSVAVSPPVAKDGDVVVIFADTTGLTEGMYVVYINVQTALADRLTSQNIRAYIIITSSIRSC